jgi:16S rRNA (uracil1498-N3)-methyltransferase
MPGLLYSHWLSAETTGNHAAFLLSPALTVGATVALPEAVAHHLHVLRLEAGRRTDPVQRRGRRIPGTTGHDPKKSARQRHHQAAFVARDVELPYEITLAQALPEGAKMDWIIEKAVELGVAAIQPLAAQRCVVRLSAERAAKKRRTGKA